MACASDLTRGGRQLELRPVQLCCVLKQTLTIIRVLREGWGGGGGDGRPMMR